MQIRWSTSGEQPFFSCPPVGRGACTAKKKNKENYSLNSHSDVNYTLWHSEGKGGRSISTEIISHLAIIRGAAIRRHHTDDSQIEPLISRLISIAAAGMFPPHCLPSVIDIRRFRGFHWPALHQIKSIGHVVITQAVSHLLTSFDSKHKKHYGNNDLKLHRESCFCCVEKWLWSILSWVLMVASNLSLCFPHPWTEEMFTCGWQGSRRFEEASLNLLLIWSETLPDSLTRGQTPGSLRPDADRLRRCLRGKKNLLLAKIEQKALHVLSDKTHVTPLCLVSMDTSLEIFPRLPPDCLECRRQTASEGLGSGEAQAERRL